MHAVRATAHSYHFKQWELNAIMHPCRLTWNDPQICEQVETYQTRVTFLFIETQCEMILIHALVTFSRPGGDFHS